MQLVVYSSNRAIREQKAMLSFTNSFLPKMLSIAEFEKRVVIPKRPFVDSLQRKLFLQEASKFDGFKKLKINQSFVKFFTHSDDIFRFFEELAQEKVTINELFLQDINAIVDDELQVLEILLKRYKEILQKHHLSDTIFLYDENEWELNKAYLKNFEKIIVKVDGYLTKFEIDLFTKIAKITEVELEFFVTPFYKKMQEVFKNLGFNVEYYGFYRINLRTKEIFFDKKQLQIKTQAIATTSRLLQIPLALAKIEEFVQSGIKPDKIALILPDESIAPIIKKYDRLNNLNFAMGFSFVSQKGYIQAKKLYEALKGSKEAKNYLKALGIDTLSLPKDEITLKEFFETLKNLGFSFYENLEKNLEEFEALKEYFIFCKIFQNKTLFFTDWLYLWLEYSKKFRIDDVKGGKVTAVGLLESRGVEFEAVVIIDFNENFVPTISNKERFLNSDIRKRASLPTRADRENLQKHYYFMALYKAKKSAIIFVENEENTPSKFLYELGIKGFERFHEPLELLYEKGNVFINSHLNRPKIAFDATQFFWSNSKLKTFLNCKRAFYYRYIANLQEDESAFNEGKVLHEILAKVLKPSVYYDSFEALKKSFLIEVDNFFFDDFELEYKKMLWREALDNFLLMQYEHLQNGWKIVASEKQVMGEIKGLKFVGIIDRIDKKEQELFLLDYKSGAIDNKKDASKSNDFQLLIYDMLYGGKEKKLAFIDLFKAEIIELQSYEEKKERLLEHIQKLKETKEITLDRCEDLSLCRFCAYRLLCHRGEYL